MNLNKVILNSVINGLNSLEQGEAKHITLSGDISEHNAGELHSYLRTYNVEVNKAVGNNYYSLTISKKESK